MPMIEVSASMQGMRESYIPCHPEQQQILPSAIQDWLPQGNLAYFINDTVTSLDLSAFHARYAADGPRNQPFHPAMMVKVLIDACASDVFSSHMIAKKRHEDVAFGCSPSRTSPPTARYGSYARFT